ncbi:MAG: TetR/AcrR family transcriptional regulator [Chloroflexi bacterium]|nr:MAG: TetR/AcrR family transcriptional regulator [Chloroflexota bacterium]
MTTASAAPPPTRQRLLDAALELFADRGFADTTVGDLEAEAGLSPRAGGLYKHFASKEAVLREALERFVSGAERVTGTAFELMPLGDIRAELTLIARAGVAYFSANGKFIRIMQQERARFPDLVKEMYERAVAPAYALGAAWLQRQMESGFFPRADAQALAIVVMSPFVTYQIDQETFGRPTADVGPERFIAAWVDAMVACARGAVQGDS